MTATYRVDDSIPSQIICPRCDGYGCRDGTGMNTRFKTEENRCRKSCHLDWVCWICPKCDGLGWVASPLLRVFFDKNKMALPKRNKKINYGRSKRSNEVSGVACDLSDDSWSNDSEDS